MTTIPELGLVRVASTKFDGSLHYDYPAHLLEGAWSDGELRLFVPAGTTLHSYRGDVPLRQSFTQVFWPGASCWWNLEHYHVPLAFEGRPSLLSYANVGLPAQFDGETVTWVDLDLDVIVTAAGVRLIDEDDFEENRERFAYPPDVIAAATDAAQTLLTLAVRLEPPFDRDSYIW